MPSLEPPDNHFLDAATGWLMLGNAEEARREFEQMRTEAQAHPDALDFQWRWFAHEKRWEDAVDVAQRWWIGIRSVPRHGFTARSPCMNCVGPRRRLICCCLLPKVF